jgi:hypothetical protein
MEDRVRLNKLKEVFENNNTQYTFWGWRRTKETKSKNYAVKHLWTGGGFSSKKLFLHYPMWIVMVFINSFKLSSRDTIYAVSLDVALPIYLGSFFKGYTYIFDNPDNFSLTYNLKGFPKWLIDRVESKVAERAMYHILPDGSRFEESHDNIVILPNFPLESEIKRAQEIYEAGMLDTFDLSTITTDKRFKIYINGRMVKHRGSEWIADIFGMLDPEKFLVIVAGNIYCEKLKSRLQSMDNVVKFERLENYKALSLYYCVDIVFAFYDPVLPINRKAAANKWWDCVTCKVPFVSNIEVETLRPFREANACFAIPYGDDDALLALLNELAKHTSKLDEIRENFEILSTYSWGRKMDELVHNSLTKIDDLMDKQ